MLLNPPHAAHGFALATQIIFPFESRWKIHKLERMDENEFSCGYCGGRRKTLSIEVSPKDEVLHMCVFVTVEHRFMNKLGKGCPKTYTHQCATEIMLLWDSSKFNVFTEFSNVLCLALPLVPCLLTYRQFRSYFLRKRPSTPVPMNHNKRK